MNGRRWMSVAVAGLALVSGLLLVRCSGSREVPPPVGPVLVVGMDGLEWDVVLHLIRNGRMRHLARLMERGQAGLLETDKPTHSPVLWTTVATGKTADQHGIRGFEYRDAAGEPVLYNRTDRKTKALWNILSDEGQTVHSIGWWMTFPAEPVRGVMVAQTNHVSQRDTLHGNNVWKGRLRSGLPGQVWPPSHVDFVMSTLERLEAGELDALTKSVFGTFQHDLSELLSRLWKNCRWSFRADATYATLANELFDAADEDERPAVSMVYFGGTDVVGHRFWRFMQPDPFQTVPTKEELEDFGNIIFDYYDYIDDKLGELIELHGPKAHIFVVSDHGMGPVNLRGRFDPNDPPKIVNSGDHQDAPPGVLVVAGPTIASAGLQPTTLEKRTLPTLGSLLDLAPTWLAMRRIPLGEDMPGRVLSELFTDAAQIDLQPDSVPTHDDAAFRTQQAEAFAVDGPMSEERLEQLRELGYID